MECPSYRCDVRTKLICNLKNEHIRFTNCGSILWVESRAFVSIRDFEERAFRGFTELSPPPKSETKDTPLEFSYDVVPRSKSHEKGIMLFQRSHKKTHWISSKILLDAHYKILQSPFSKDISLRISQQGKP